MTPIAFEKWQALGNDYLIFEERALPFALTPQRIRRICDSHTGVGSDGILLLSEPDEPGFVARLRIFNPDGSEAELSGNGAREAVMYLRRDGWTDSDRFSIQTARRRDPPAHHRPETTCTLDMGRARTSLGGLPVRRRRRRRHARGRRARRGAFSTSRSATRSARSTSPTRAELDALDLPAIGGAIVAPRAVSQPHERLAGSPSSSPASSARGSSSAAWGRRCPPAPAPAAPPIAYVLRGGDSPVTVRLDGGELVVDVEEDLHFNLSGWARARVPGRARRRLPHRTGEPVKPSRRLDRIPPYLFAELERKIAAKKRAGRRRHLARASATPTARRRRSSSTRCRRRSPSPRRTATPPTAAARTSARPSSDFYMRRFDVELDPDTEIMPAIGAKECIFNLNLAFLDPGDAALSADPGYPVYTGGPLIAGADPVLMPLLPEHGFTPDLDAISDADRARAKLMFFNYPNNPTGAIVRPGLLRARSSTFCAGTDILAVSRQRLLRDDLRRLPRAVVPRDARRQGRRRRGLLVVQGLQHDRLALRGDRRQRRGDRPLLAAEDEHRLGPVRGRPARRHRRAEPRRRRRQARDERALHAPPRPRRRRAASRSASTSRRRRATIYIWAPVPAGFESSAAYCEHVLEEAGVVDLARRRVRPQRRGLLPHLADDARRPPRSRPSSAWASSPR